MLVGVLGVGGAALANGARFPRQQPPPPPVTLSARTMPRVAQQAPVPAPVALDLDLFLGVTITSGPVRAEQEQIIVALIADTPDSEVEEKSDYYFRLAELYAALHIQWRRKSIELAKQQDKATAANKAKDYLLKAVKTFKALADNDRFRDYPKMDRVLFDYGYTLQSGKYLKEARAVYDKLLKNYPNSMFVPSAHLAFAEYYFDAGQLADAEARYKHVLKFPKSSAYGYALYKLGWIHMGLQRYQESLETFFQIVQLTKDDPKLQPLARAAEDGFVDAYAQIGKADKALVAFQRVNKARAAEMAAKLAQRYLDQGKSDGAIYAAQERIKADPTSKDVCRWQHEVARATLGTPSATPVDKVREIENLVAIRNALVSAGTLPQAEADECRANAAAMSGELARSWHGEFAVTKNPQTLEHAERLYRAYITSFTDAPDIDLMRDAYAEVLWSHADLEPKPRLQPERWIASAEAFMTVATTAQDAPRRAAASAAGMLAWRNALDLDGADRADLEAAARSRAKAATIPPMEDAALTALVSYAATAPDENAVVETRLLAASRYRKYQQNARAIPLLASIVDQYARHPSAEQAANLLLDSLVRAEQYDLVLQWVDRFANDPTFLEGKAALQQSIKFLRSRSLRRR